MSGGKIWRILFPTEYVPLHLCTQNSTYLIDSKWSFRIHYVHVNVNNHNLLVFWLLFFLDTDKKILIWWVIPWLSPASGHSLIVCHCSPHLVSLWYWFPKVTQNSFLLRYLHIWSYLQLYYHHFPSELQFILKLSVCLFFRKVFSGP